MSFMPDELLEQSQEVAMIYREAYRQVREKLQS